MISRNEIKKNAKKSILNNYGSVVVVSIAMVASVLVEGVLLKGLSMLAYSDWILLLGIIPVILLMPLYVGLAGFFLKIYPREGESNAKQVFTIGFSLNYKRNLMGMLIRGFKLFLWSMIGLVPLYYGLVLTLMSSFHENPMETDYRGLDDMTYVIFFATIILSIVGFIPYIIKSISYSMTPYILADQDVFSSEAVKLSVIMTNGHKLEIFKLAISFIGWILLSVITIGIVGVLWTGPYISTSFAGIYEELKSN